jgi:hypothetical protein
VWAALGLGALGFAMRRRARGERVASIAALGALMLGVGASGASALDASAGFALASADGSVPMIVQSAQSSWENGVIVTRLSLRGTDSDSVTHDVSVKALGGQVGDLVQVVGHALPPQVGDSLRIRLGSSADGEAIWLAPMADRR